MKFIDTHCHLDLIAQKEPLQFDSYPDLLLQVACHPETFQVTQELMQEPKVYAAFGVHPHEAHLYNDAVEKSLLQYLQLPKTVAIGEMGLDYHYDFSPREQQKQVFLRQLEIALEVKLPIVIHTREADDDTLEILKSVPLKGAKMHIHCYTGGIAFAQKLLELDAQIFFGFTGIVTFKTAQEIRDVAQFLPTQCLLSETDSPYLAPVPFRGKTAHPHMIPQIITTLAQCKQIDTEAMAKILWDNAINCYGFNSRI